MSQIIPPGTGLIKAIRAEKSPYYLWAGEALDNSLDASASIVNLIMESNALTATDNGRGIEMEFDEAIVKISAHGELPGTKLGRFGVGIKYKSIQHGKIFTINSVSKDGRLRRTVNWENMLATGEWRYPDANRLSVPVGTPTYTTVAISDLITRPPTKTDIDRTRSEVQRRYYPALDMGKTITVNGVRIDPIGYPQLEHEIAEEVILPEGRSAIVSAGMLVDPQNSKLRQVDLCVDFRVLVKESAFGCNGYGGIRAMFAKIMLVGPWKLTKFKEGLAEDPYEEVLEYEVGRVLKPILDRCQSASMFLKTRELEYLINTLIPEDKRMSRTRPNKKNPLDRVGEKRGEKKDTDTPDSIASISGPTKKKNHTRGIFVELCQDLNEIAGFGRSLTTKSSTRIQLSLDNPCIAELAKLRDQKIAAIGLSSIAMLIFEGDLQSITPRLVDELIGLRAWKSAGLHITSLIEDDKIQTSTA